MICSGLQYNDCACRSQFFISVNFCFSSVFGYGNANEVEKKGK